MPLKDVHCLVVPDEVDNKKRLLSQNMETRNVMPYTTRVLTYWPKTNRHCPFGSSASKPLGDDATFTDSVTEKNDIRLREDKDESIVYCGWQRRASTKNKHIEESEGDLDFTIEIASSESAFQVADGRIPSALDMDHESECFLGGRGFNVVDGNKNECWLLGKQSKSPVSPILPQLIPADKVSSATSHECPESLPIRSEVKLLRSSCRTSGHRISSAIARWNFKPWTFEFIFLSLTVLCIAPVSGGFDRGGFQHQITWGRGNSPPGSAIFGNSPANVTAVVGHRARLPCQVKNLGLKDVSWIRQRDLHILTVGIFTYTSDDRFKVFHPHETEDYYLDISSVTFRDSGIYECQVSTSPKVSLPIYLTVLGIQEADIPGPDEVFIQHGSTISLQCEVQAGVEAVGPVHWLKGADTLNYSSPRGGISMEVEKTPTKTMSKLYITRAFRADSGNYTCAPLFAKPDSVMVHVVNAGEESAAAVHSGSSHCEHGKIILIWAATLLPVTWLFLNLSSIRP
ncbi:hemicentin-1-like [Palaemon carinicauda]|uniref:hemicentin-1-like n=1 Tax=Palaemon carinicauda TaxID=392227 RepID=UPI0035B5E0A5